MPDTSKAPPLKAAAAMTIMKPRVDELLAGAGADPNAATNGPDTD